MDTRKLTITAAFFFVVGGVFSSGEAYAQSRTGASHHNDVTTTDTKAAIAREKAESAREAADEAEKEAVAAQLKAAQDKQRSAADRADALEKELAAFKAQENERGLVLTLGDVQFAPNQEKLTAETMRKLYPLITMLKEQDKRNIRIEGYTDSSGEKNYNLDLSQRRADAVRDFLIENGIRPERITARGYGEDNAIASNDTVEGRRENRRVEVIIPRAEKRSAR